MLARLPQEHQAGAYDQCWRKDWQDKEPHLLPAKHLSAWIQANLYLSLADAPFKLTDTTLNPVAGACVTCPRRSGFNVSLFAYVQGDQCQDAPCFHLKITAHLDREAAARPGLVQIEADAAFRDRAGALKATIDQRLSELSVNRGVYNALSAMSLPANDPGTRYYVTRELLMFHLAGVDKDEATRHKLTQLRTQLSTTQSRFERHGTYWKAAKPLDASTSICILGLASTAMVPLRSP